MVRLIIHFSNLFLLSTFTISATIYYVATSYGDDSNNGTPSTTPYKAIGKAVSVMSSGDKCYIRHDRYHEAININDLDGTSVSAIVFTNNNNKRVVPSGMYFSSIRLKEFYHSKKMVFIK